MSCISITVSDSFWACKKSKTRTWKKTILVIQYEGSDRLYVPVDQIDRVQKYIGSGGQRPVHLNRLGGNDWARTTARAQKQVKEIAGELIALYAARQSPRPVTPSPRRYPVATRNGRQLSRTPKPPTKWRRLRT